MRLPQPLPVTAAAAVALATASGSTPPDLAVVNLCAPLQAGPSIQGC